MEKKRNIKNYLDALVDKDGLKTEVTITMTDNTMRKLILSMLIAGLSMLLITKVLRAFFPDQQMTVIQAELSEIKKILAKQ